MSAAHTPRDLCRPLNAASLLLAARAPSRDGHYRFRKHSAEYQLGIACHAMRPSPAQPTISVDTPCDMTRSRRRFTEPYRSGKRGRDLPMHHLPRTFALVGATNDTERDTSYQARLLRYEQPSAFVEASRARHDINPGGFGQIPARSDYRLTSGSSLRGSSKPATQLKFTSRLSGQATGPSSPSESRTGRDAGLARAIRQSG
jgi:hypothetical protein